MSKLSKMAVGFCYVGALAAAPAQASPQCSIAAAPVMAGAGVGSYGYAVLYGNFYGLPTRSGNICSASLFSVSINCSDGSYYQSTGSPLCAAPSSYQSSGQINAPLYMTAQARSCTVTVTTGPTYNPADDSYTEPCVASISIPATN